MPELTQEEKDIISNALIYALPDMKRGPANGDWTESVRKAAELADWKECEYCKPYESSVCYECLNIGYVRE